MRSKFLIFGVLVLLYVVAAVIFNSRIGADFWPPDNSRIGPNLVANVVWILPAFTAGLLTGRHMWRKTREHHEWVARHVARTHEAATGEKAQQHPHFDL